MWDFGIKILSKGHKWWHVVNAKPVNRGGKCNTKWKKWIWCRMKWVCFISAFWDGASPAALAVSATSGFNHWHWAIKHDTGVNEPVLRVKLPELLLVHTLMETRVKDAASEGKENSTDQPEEPEEPTEIHGFLIQNSVQRSNNEQINYDDDSNWNQQPIWRAKLSSLFMVSGQITIHILMYVQRLKKKMKTKWVQWQNTKLENIFTKNWFDIERIFFFGVLSFTQHQLGHQNTFLSSSDSIFTAAPISTIPFGQHWSLEKHHTATTEPRFWAVTEPSARLLQRPLWQLCLPKLRRKKQRKRAEDAALKSPSGR